jgi:hypothetical protein
MVSMREAKRYEVNRIAFTAFKYDGDIITYEEYDFNVLDHLLNTGKISPDGSFSINGIKHSPIEEIIFSDEKLTKRIPFADYLEMGEPSKLIATITLEYTFDE